MKILILIGSYRKNGNTALITARVKHHLEQLALEHHAPIDVETIYLGEEELGYCRGCRACMDRGEEKCPLKDSMPAIREKMRDADGLLVASPIYVDDVSGIIKSWIDRLGYVCHRPEFAGKCAYAISTVGGSHSAHTLGNMTQALTLWGFYVVGSRGFKTGARMKAEEIQAQFDPQTQQIARSLFQAIHQRRYLDPSFRSLLTFKIQQNAWQRAGQEPTQQDTVDYQYWKDRGWLEPQTHYYIPHRSHPLKVAVARLLGAAIAPLVS